MELQFLFSSHCLVMIYICTKFGETRTVRKSDFTPALALVKHMAGVFDKNVERKEKEN